MTRAECVHLCVALLELPRALLLDDIGTKPFVDFFYEGKKNLGGDDGEWLFSFLVVIWYTAGPRRNRRKREGET